MMENMGSRMDKAIFIPDSDVSPRRVNIQNIFQRCNRFTNLNAFHFDYLFRFIYCTCIIHHESSFVKHYFGKTLTRIIVQIAY